MKSCLIVDDSAVIRKVAKRILASKGVAVTEAATAHEGLTLYRMHEPELVIVDATLPDRQTVDFIRDIMAVRTAGKPFVAVLLNEFDIGTIMRCRRAGAKSHILKPFTRALLLARIAEITGDASRAAA